MKPVLSLILFLMGLPFLTEATHLRGGYIRAESTGSNSLTYKIQIVAFTDTGSSIQMGGGEISFGDGEVYQISEGALLGETHVIGDEIAYQLIEITHTYPAFGTYTIEIKEYYRNAGIINMDNSVSAPFYAETTIAIGPEIGANTTPTLITTPAIWTKAGSRFYGSIACADKEGDSLVYSLAAPKEIFKAGTEQEEQEPFNFKWPNSKTFYFNEGDFLNPVLSLDPLSAQLVWDTPLAEGEFALAYRVLEYRKVNATWIKISESQIDIQLVNTLSGESTPGVAFDHEIAEDGRINFTVEYEAEDSVSWLFYSELPVEWQGVVQNDHYLRGEGSGELLFTGSIAADAASNKPVIVVAEISHLAAGSRLKSIKSYAIHPTGKEYVLTSVNKADIGKLNIYPNPSAGLLNIRMPGETGLSYVGSQLQVQVVNLSGQSILKDGLPLSGELATLNIEGIPAGVYVLRVSLGERTYLSKLIKK